MTEKQKIKLRLAYRVFSATRRYVVQHKEIPLEGFLTQVENLEQLLANIAALREIHWYNFHGHRLRIEATRYELCDIAVDLIRYLRQIHKTEPIPTIKQIDLQGLSLKRINFNRFLTICDHLQEMVADYSEEITHLSGDRFLIRDFIDLLSLIKTENHLLTAKLNLKRNAKSDLRGCLSYCSFILDSIYKLASSNQDEIPELFSVYQSLFDKSENEAKRKGRKNEILSHLQKKLIVYPFNIKKLFQEEKISRDLLKDEIPICRYTIDAHPGFNEFIEINYLPEGVYQIEFDVPGMKMLRKTIVIVEGEPLTIAFPQD